MKIKKIGLKKQLFNLNVVISIGIIIIIVFFLFVNRLTKDMYNNTIQMYDDLSEMYTNLEEAHFNMRNYLSTANKDEKLSFESHMKKVKQLSMDVESKVAPALKWRFDLLNNMIMSYTESVDTILKSIETDNGEYAVNYNEFLNQYELIQETGSIYYEYLTGQMKLDREVINRNEMYNVIGIIFIAGTALLFVIYYSVRTVRSITNPIYAILNNMKLIRNGEYDLSSISNTSEEMEVLCDALEELASNVKQNVINEREKAELHTKLLEKENEGLKKDELLAQSELRLLQNQINPHFLFNSLNMIHKTSIQEEAMQTSEMVQKTSELLRYGLDKTNKTSNLQSEIDAIKNYIYIQTLRFDSRIDFKLMVAEHVPNIQLPGMILQPLVENAVKHGFKHIVSDAEVIIKVEYENNHIILSVSDNGEGVETAELDELLIEDFEQSRAKLGLYNVIQRIRMFYGKNVNVSINSYPDCGFEILIDINMEDF